MSTKSQLSPMHEWAENQLGLTWSLPNDDSLRVGSVQHHVIISVILHIMSHNCRFHDAIAVSFISIKIALFFALPGLVFDIGNVTWP